MSFLSILMVFTLTFTYNFISCQDWNECRRLGFSHPENDDPFMTNFCILNSSTSQNCFPDFVCVQNHPGNPYHGICCRQDATPPQSSAVTKPQELFTTTSGQIHNACPENQHYEICPECPEWTCDRVNAKRLKRENSNNDCSKRSKNTTENCVFESGCYCNQGYARLGNKTGPCVSYAQCHFPDCGPNAHFEQCPQWNDVNCAEIKVKYANIMDQSSTSN
ncbi:hypothetical protein DdX_03831 [Ditylenchus destructor]|uniref:Uncharacterized protein n=1 Tax=Ditylenchus destructor TaxID=166010 RepID=A0AAD4N9H3_9BILA|nr:hypothetical protein DdX_03831 [Ditylenchus destructor]